MTDFCRKDKINKKQALKEHILKKTFNTNGICYPEKHYMVSIESRLREIRLLVDNGDYFIINRARQFGKTTTLVLLQQYLQQDYVVISLDFQGMSTADFRNEHIFCKAFLDALLEELSFADKNALTLPAQCVEELKNESADPSEMWSLSKLFRYLQILCKESKYPIVLMIDEVDSAANNQVFLDFLSQLRKAYLKRQKQPTFQSVILAGVYDIKNLRHKIRPDDSHRYNSPWNIAADFKIDMSFSVKDICGMLSEYEQDNQTGMNIPVIADEIYDYTAGYPYLVSRICKLLDEQLIGRDGFENYHLIWTSNGIVEAVKELLKESNTLFDDMSKKLADYPELRDMLYSILFNGKAFPYVPDNFAIQIGQMFGFITEKDGMTAVTNRIFETRLYNLFLSETLINNASYQAGLLDKNQFIQEGNLNMELVLKKFAEHFSDIYSDCEQRFVEDNGRRLFLLYLKPIINGVGNYYIEARTRDMRRTDVIVDYRGRQYVIEMKLWRGEEYNKRGENQLSGYLDDYHLTKGYMLSFNFNKNKTTGIKTITIGNKTIVEAVV